MLFAAGCLAFSLALGIFGFHLTEGWAWLDSLMAASMLLSGMGPTMSPVTTCGKLFASAYALFSGVVFLGMVAVIIAPIAHRMLHIIHLEGEQWRKGLAKPEEDGEARQE